MKIKRKQYGSLIAFFLLAALIFSGCGMNVLRGDSGEGGTTVRISMYNDIAYSGWRTYVEGQCPDITFIWENNRNDTQNLIYQAKHGDMADIVMIRRFENDSAAELAPYLMDLGKESLTSSFAEGVLKPFTFGGKICWYPAPGMIEALYANASLFDRNGIKLPETIGELEEACREFKQRGIDGLSIDASFGYRSTFLLEGFAHASYFSGEEGSEWLKSFLSGQTTSLTESGGAQLASLLRGFTANSVLEPSDLTVSTANMLSAFDTEKAAMIANGSDHPYKGKSETKYQIIPCLGNGKDDKILYTYPVFSTAVSRKADEFPEKKSTVERVLKVMYSAEAQQILAKGTEALMSYNRGIDLPVSELYQSVDSLIREKKCFIRFLNRNMFSASSAAVKGMIEGSLSDASFTEKFNAALGKPMDTKVIGISSIEAGNQMGAKYPLERLAASVIAQTVKGATEADVVLLEGKSAAAPIYKGSYTESDLNAAVADDALFEANLTGSQLQDIFNDSILATTTFSYLDIEPIMDYPALSGMKAFLSMDGRENVLLLPDGSLPAKDKPYHVVISRTVLRALTYLQNENCSAFHQIDTTLQSTFRDRLSSGSLPKPEEYFKVGASE